MTAEFAVALPAVVLVIALGVGALGGSARQVRLQDAAADAARLLARGEGAARAQAVIDSAVGGAVSSAVTMSVDRRADLVCVTAATDVRVIVNLPISATSCALEGGL